MEPQEFDFFKNRKIVMNKIFLELILRMYMNFHKDLPINKKNFLEFVKFVN